MSSGQELPALVQYWDAKPPPDYIDALIATFADHNPDLRHLVFDEAAAAELIARHFSSREVAAFRSCAVAAMQADYFRYCAVLALGGVYADADFRCVGPLRPLLERECGGTLFRAPNRSVINGLFAFGSAGHPLPRLALEVATANIENRISDRVWVTTGPAIFSGLSYLLDLGSLDALIEFCTHFNRGGLATLARSICDVVGEYDRVAEAFRDVDVLPRSDADAYIQSLGRGHLLYKRTAAHYPNAGPSIFR